MARDSRIFCVLVSIVIGVTRAFGYSHSPCPSYPVRENFSIGRQGKACRMLCSHLEPNRLNTYNKHSLHFFTVARRSESRGLISPA